MEGPRLTEERLRYHLDSNQVMRERMCLALLPLLGPYSREQPRRPKGGPDGGRDIEAMFDSKLIVWGAIGFRNGGGADDQARNEIEEKFTADFSRSLSENPELKGFVFFTNVDLTPGRREKLKSYAQKSGVEHIAIFDMEKLRAILDSPEGLIARLQYLEIVMTNTEQAALIDKFGNQLQNAVTARFDRVERILSKMEKFLDLQKPLSRLDFYIDFLNSENSNSIGKEAILINLSGLLNDNQILSCLIVNKLNHPNSESSIILSTTMWINNNKSKTISFLPSISNSSLIGSSYTDINITSGLSRFCLSNLSILNCDAFCTSGFHSKIRKISIDANGYELIQLPVNSAEKISDLNWPDDIPFEASTHDWIRISGTGARNFLFDSLILSGRLSPIQLIKGY